MKTTPPLSEPKQARAIETHRQILDAAVRSLCETGHGGTTTTVVARRAGVSQGALFKHFGSKQQLLAATTGHLFDRLIGEFRAAFAAGARDDDPVARALLELWRVFLAPELYAVLELYMVSRTDKGLRQAMVPVMLRHRENLLVEARALFPEAAAKNPRFEAGVEAIMSAMQGAAISVAVLQEQADGAAFHDFLEHVWRRELEFPYGESK